MSYWHRKKVCITGGAGFIGSNLAKDLVKEGCFVRVVDNLERGRLENLGSVIKSIEFVEKDICYAEVCNEICKDMDVVFHLASKVGGIGYYLEKPGEVITQNIRMDLNVLEAVLRQNVQRYFYASSAHVYPIELQREPNSQALKEEDVLPAHPGLSYGWAKLIAEKQIECLIRENRPLKAAIARLIGIYGENQDIDLQTGSAIPVFCRRAIEYSDTAPFIIWGIGKETRSYCFIEDAVEAMKKMVVKLEKKSLVGPLNIGKSERIAIGDLAQHVVKTSGKNIKIQCDKTKETQIWGQMCDCSKAKAELNGWEAKTPLEVGLTRSYAYVERRLKEIKR